MIAAPLTKLRLAAASPQGDGRSHEQPFLAHQRAAALHGTDAVDLDLIGHLYALQAGLSAEGSRETLLLIGG